MLLEAHSEGTIFSVQAHAGGKKNEICSVLDDTLKVSVTQSPEKGKANKAIIALLSKCLSLRKSQLEIIAGATARRKRLLARGVSPQELAERIQRALSGKTS